MGGIEYFTDINPTNLITNKVLQNQYNMEYKIAEHMFYSDLYISKDIINTHLNKHISYELIIDFSSENDEIKTNTNYGVKFLKSIFLFDKQRDIIKNIKEYYSDYIVTGPFLNIIGENKKAVFIISKRLQS